MSDTSMQNYAPPVRSGFRLSLVVLVLLALVASACGGSAESSEPDVSSPAEDASIGIEPDAPDGVIYVTTRDGDLVAVDPATSESDELWDGDSEELSPVIEVAALDRSSGLHVLLSDADRQLSSTLTKLDGARLEPLVADFVTPFLLCLDPHPGAETSMGHLLGLGSADPSGAGTTFEAVAFQGVDSVDVDAGGLPERASVVCPRWTGTRDSVATAAPPTDDLTTITAHVDGAIGSIEIGRDGCAVTPSAFGPDDQALVIAATCYGDHWADSGLYLVRLDDTGDTVGLSDAGVVRLAADNFGRAAWHPDGEWLVASRSGLIEGQTPESGLADQPGDLLLVHPGSGTLIDITLDDGDSPHSVAWLPAAVHG